MESEYGPVESVKKRVSLVGNDMFVVPAAGIIDDYITDRRRRGKIEKKKQLLVSVKDGMSISGYAKQYCPKDRNTYYYKAKEHLPQLYDTRGGQPEGKMVPERIFDSVVKANETPVNNNYMRIVGRSQSEDPRGRFNPADYMTSATTGLSEGFGKQQPVNNGEKTMFGQPVSDPKQGLGSSRDDPGDLPPPRGGPSGTDDDDDSSGGGGKPGIFDYAGTWIDKISMIFERKSTEEDESYYTASEGSSSDYGSMSSYSSTEFGSLDTLSEDMEVFRDAPIEQFETIRLTPAEYNQMRVDAFLSRQRELDNMDPGQLVSQRSRQMFARPNNDQGPNIRTMADIMGRDNETPPGASSTITLTATPRLNPRRPEPGNVFQNDRFSDDRLTQMEDRMEQLDVQVSNIVNNVAETQQVNRNHLETVQTTWMTTINQYMAAVANNQYGTALLLLNKLRQIVGTVVWISTLAGGIYGTYRGMSNINHYATRAGNAVVSAGNSINAGARAIDDFFGIVPQVEWDMADADGAVDVILDSTPTMEYGWWDQLNNPPTQSSAPVRATIGAPYQSGSLEFTYRRNDEPMSEFRSARSGPPEGVETNSTRVTPGQAGGIQTIGGMAAALYMGRPLLRYLGGLLTSRNTTNVQQIPVSGSLRDNSESLEYLARSAGSPPPEDPPEPEPTAGPSQPRRSSRNARKIYSNLNEREMAQKSGKEKDFSDRGI